MNTGSRPLGSEPPRGKRSSQALHFAADENLRSISALLLAAPAFAQSTADAIIARELQTSRAYETLSHITDDIGARLTGSKGAAKAVQWTTQQFREWGIDGHERAGDGAALGARREEARLVSPADHNIVLTAIGGSVATPAAGITADVIEVDSFDELKTLGAAKLRGKIVFYNNPMDMELVRTHRAFEAYRKRRRVPRRPARARRGGVRREGGGDPLRRIGVAAHAAHRRDALRPEAAEDPGRGDDRRRRDARASTARAGQARAHAPVLTPRTLPDVMSANVIAEIRGSEKPEEIVLIGAHLDSWDLGTGAIDDGSGVAMVMETMRLLKEMS